MNWTTFLLNKNASKIFYDFLRPTSTHTEGPSDFEKIVIALITKGVQEFRNSEFFPISFFYEVKVHNE